MQPDLAKQRQEARSLLDGLPEEKFIAIRNLLAVLAEPHVSSLSRSLAAAPVEEEELNPNTMAALHRASASLDRGEGVSHDAMLANSACERRLKPRKALDPSGPPQPRLTSEPSTAPPPSRSSIASTDTSSRAMEMSRS